ncbi:MAG TPA: hypothetical protein DCZ94_20705 [Lentisphaeria bacterium]|nr:MAG: hypothetical protein A2X48_09145 [Lentisphaerae bacterium GWF2_49_21]HBC89368.1 hypothetical protein [Lentisphaeria bacterium]
MKFNFSINGIQEFLKSLSGARKSFDPSIFNDPLAGKTGWTPAKGGGANFCTHRLIAMGPERMEFRSSWGAKFFYLIFLFIGLGVMLAVPIAMYSEGKLGLNPETIVPILIGSIFAIIGGIMLYFGTKPIVFDRRAGHFWKGWQNPEKMLNPETLKHYTKLNQIHALQLVSEYCSGNKSSYYSYELNLVLEDGSRINVIDHGNSEKLRKDAQSLSTFLGKPVWDGI